MTVSDASANTLLQRSAGARLRGQTASLFMLAMRSRKPIALVFCAVGKIYTLASQRAWTSHLGTARLALRHARQVQPGPRSSPSSWSVSPETR